MIFLNHRKWTPQLLHVCVWVCVCMLTQRVCVTFNLIGDIKETNGKYSKYFVHYEQLCVPTSHIYDRTCRFTYTIICYSINGTEKQPTKIDRNEMKQVTSRVAKEHREKRTANKKIYAQKGEKTASKLASSIDRLNGARTLMK